MKKKLLSILLALCMVVALVPMSVFAASGTLPNINEFEIIATEGEVEIGMYWSGGVSGGDDMLSVQEYKYNGDTIYHDRWLDVTELADGGEEYGFFYEAGTYIDIKGFVAEDTNGNSTYDIGEPQSNVMTIDTTVTVVFDPKTEVKSIGIRDTGRMEYGEKIWEFTVGEEFNGKLVSFQKTGEPYDGSAGNTGGVVVNGKFESDMQSLNNVSFTGTFDSNVRLDVFNVSGDATTGYTQTITTYPITSGGVTPPADALTINSASLKVESNEVLYTAEFSEAISVADMYNFEIDVYGTNEQTLPSMSSRGTMFTNEVGGKNIFEIPAVHYYDHNPSSAKYENVKITVTDSEGAVVATHTQPINLTVTQTTSTTQYTISDDGYDGSNNPQFSFLPALPAGSSLIFHGGNLFGGELMNGKATYYGGSTHASAGLTASGTDYKLEVVSNGAVSGDAYSATGTKYPVVYSAQPPLPSQNLTWSDNTANGGTKNATFGTAFTAPTATNSTGNGGEITYSVPANNDVATIAADGTVTITGTGTTTVTATAAATATHSATSITYILTVSGKALTNNMLTINPTNYTFTGGAITPTFTVSDSGTTLEEDVDYTVSVTNNINAGTDTARVSISGINNYSGIATKTFSITQKSPPNPVPTKTDSVTYSNTDEQVVDLSDVIPADAGTITAINVSKPDAANGGDLIATVSGDTIAKNAKYTLANNLTAGNVNETIDLIANVQTQNYTMIAVTITVTISPKTDQASFGFASDTKTLTYGAYDYTLAASGAVTGSTVKYVSSVPAVATVDENTGAITILKSGSTVITATAVETADYNEASDSYTLTVNRAPLTITAPNLSIYEGETVPTSAELTNALAYSGFVKDESATVFSTAPTASTTADKDVPGDYAITVTGVPADSNYNIAALNGKLTVIDRVSAVLPPQQSIDDNTNSSEPIIALGDGVTFTDKSGNPIPAPANETMRISMASAVSSTDKAALDSGLTDPKAGTQRVFLELSLMVGNEEVLPQGQVEIFIPYSKLVASPAINQNSNVKLLHLMSDNTYETITPEMLPNGLRFTANGLSPFVLYNLSAETAGGPSTGDDSNLLMPVSVMLLAIAGMGSMVVYRKKLTTSRKK